MREFDEWNNEVIARLVDRGVPFCHDRLVSSWNLDHGVKYTALAQEEEYLCNQPPSRFNQAIRCGCFRCGKFFTPDDIIWEDGIAECPFCGMDAVLAESEDFPLTEELLLELSQKQFARNPF